MEAAIEEVIDVRPPLALTFGIGVADADLLEERHAVWIVIEPVMRAPLPVAVDHLLGALVSGEREIAVVVLVLGAEVPRLDRAEPGNPNRRMRLLNRLRPQVNVAQLGVLAVEGERLALLPGFDDQVVRFVIFVAQRSSN